jgi:hypothetical protein
MSEKAWSLRGRYTVDATVTVLAPTFEEAIIKSKRGEILCADLDPVAHASFEWDNDLDHVEPIEE